MTAIESLRSHLLEKEAILITEDCVIRWLTGFYTDNGLVYISADSAVLFTDARYSEAAKRVVTSMKVKNSSNLHKDARALCKKEKTAILYIQQHATSLKDLDKLQDAYEEIFLFTDESLDTWIRDLRAVKSDIELENLKKAQKITDDGFSYILTKIKPGKTEKEIALDLEFYIRQNGAEAVSFDFIAVSGANSSLPHGVPSNKVIEDGDFLTLDFGAVVGGMHADMTRTVIVGKPTKKQKAVYETVLKAQKACIETLKAGLSCHDGDRAARKIIEEAGYGEYFTHSTGHGVGFEIHEAPNLTPNNTKTILSVGNVVTVEPGIYIPGQFGVRIEDMVLITEDGCIDLTASEKNLIQI